MVKVLNITSIKELRGGDMQMLALTEELQKNKSFEGFILTQKGSELSSILQTKKITYFESKKSNNFDLRFVRKIIHICKKHTISILHAHDSTALNLSLLASSFVKNCQIVYSRKSSNLIKDKKLNRWKYNHPKIKAYICVSNAVKKVLSKTVTDQSKILTIYDGIPLPKEVKPKTENLLYREFNLPKDTIIIGTVGALVRQKDLTIFIDVCELVSKKIKNIVFIIFGKGVLKKELKEYVKTKKLEDKLIFGGFRTNINELLPQFDTLLITSIIEGLPLTIYEAFYHKVPVITTSAGGIAEAIQDRKTGMLCNIKDTGCLASKLIEIIENKSLKNTIINNGKDIFNSRFTIEIMALHYHNFYSNL